MTAGARLISAEDRFAGPSDVSLAGAHATTAPRSQEEKGQESMMKKLIIATVLVVASAGSALAQDVAAGAKSFRKCTACHAVGPGAKNKVGPQLNGIDGRKSGTAPDYSYSDANKNSGITWNEKEFLDYIKNPRARIKGTKMIFPGIKKVSEAKNLWAYLSQFKADGSKK
jgi:cytochrome c